MTSFLLRMRMTSARASMSLTRYAVCMVSSDTIVCLIISSVIQCGSKGRPSKSLPCSTDSTAAQALHSSAPSHAVVGVVLHAFTVAAPKNSYSTCILTSLSCFSLIPPSYTWSRCSAPNMQSTHTIVMNQGSARFCRAPWFTIQLDAVLYKDAGS